MPISRLLKQAPTRAKPTPPPQIHKHSASDRQSRLEAEAEIASYIAQLSGEMSALAETSRLDLLAYFLSLARLEAETIVRRPVMDDLQR